MGSVLRQMPGHRAWHDSGGLDGMAQRPGDGGRRADAPGWARPALAACLLAVVAAGLRVTVPAPALNGPFRHDGLAVAAVLEAVLVCALIALIIRGTRAPRDALLAAQLRKMLLYVVVAGLVAVPLTYVLSRKVPTLPPRPTKVKVTPPKTSPLHSRPAGHNGIPLIVLIILGLLALAVLVYIAVLLVRRRFWLGLRGRDAGFAVEATEADDESDLREAVESGQSALRRFDDAKAAIIACYVAMEESLARAGAARAVADTPDELLARAAGSGLVRTGAAARLTALFYEARFSSHPMPLAQRDEAQQALAELAGSLRDLETAGADTAADAGRTAGAGPAGTAGTTGTTGGAGGTTGGGGG
jgi:Tfp pilus assembly protein PilX